MSYEFDHIRIEQIIRQAKQERANYMAEVCAPAFKTIAGLALLLVLAALIPA